MQESGHFYLALTARPQWMTVELYRAAPDTLVVRELEVGGRVLVTTLLCPNITPKKCTERIVQAALASGVGHSQSQNHAGHDHAELQNPGDGRKRKWGIHLFTVMLLL